MDWFDDLPFEGQCAIIVCASLLLLALIYAVVGGHAESRYHDGRCYLCRRGKCCPGMSCPKCGTPQP